MAVYTITDEATGTPLAAYSPDDYPSGERGALNAAAMRARHEARPTSPTHPDAPGRPVLLTSDTPGFLTRRYSPVYIRRNLQYPYRVQASCGHWVYPKRLGELCRTCRKEQGQTQAQRAAVARSNRRRTKPG